MSQPIKRRVTLVLDGRDLAIVGAEPASKSVASMLHEYAALVEAAGYHVACAFREPEWWYMLAVFDRCVGAIGTGYRIGTDDFTQAVRLSQTWEGMGESVEQIGGGAEVMGLAAKVGRLTEIERKALLLALRHGLRVSRGDDPPEVWWTVWSRLSWHLVAEPGDQAPAREDAARG